MEIKIDRITATNLIEILDLLLKVISRKDAKRLGISRYFTGNPCPRGHVAERRTRNGECIICCASGNKTRTENYRRECPERLVEYKRRDYQNNKPAHRRRSNKWARENPDKISQMNQRWRRGNKKRFAAMVQDWRQRNPAKYRQQKYRRRMLEATAEGHFTEEYLLILLEQQNSLCIGPGCGVDILETFTVDHKIPLSRGGNNDPKNLQLLCKSCNSAKGIKTDEEWRIVNAG